MKIWKQIQAFLFPPMLLVYCQPIYYNALEKIGIEKRDILENRVQDAVNSQEQAKEQFQDALEKFQSVVPFEGGNLEKVYDRLKGELEQSRQQAEAIDERVGAVEDVAEDLFEEWESELDKYESSSLRRQSARQLAQTRRRYQRMITAMREAQSRIDPVLQPLEDYVLFLKHNLNARAIASLEGELTNSESSVSSLVTQMEEAITEAESFLKTMKERE